ncbi:uncharacterized protein LOC105232383 [Bactrocera dorsalis]|uniref:Uncharacterized protein LOC105232383 n=1 Tax=Bactrocera dorsalis TaxID=27457 RepID=A0A6I9VK62_BACDO|nr:uncharacterized protein LOC105232383 [Bactrocera dorsalis]
MSTSWLVLLLSCCMALRFAAAFPQQAISKTNESQTPLSQESSSAATDNNASSKNTNIKLSLAKNNLLLDTLEILANQSTDILHTSNTLIRNLIAELKAQPNRTTEIDRYIDRFDQALKHIEKIDFAAEQAQLEDIFASVDEIGAIFYDIEDIDDGDSEILQGAFDRVGAESIDKQFRENMESTLITLANVFDDFVNSLSAVDRQAEHQLIDWFERFQKEDDYEEKLGNLIDEFLQFFE